MIQIVIAVGLCTISLIRYDMYRPYFQSIFSTYQQYFPYYYPIGLSNQMKFAMLSSHFHVLILWSKHHIFHFQTNH